MKGIDKVVVGIGMVNSITKSIGCIADAVCNRADHRAEEALAAVRMDVGLDVVMAKDDVRQVAVTVRRIQAYHPCSEVCDLRRNATVFQRIQPNRHTINLSLKPLFRNQFQSSSTAPNHDCRSKHPYYSLHNTLLLDKGIVNSRGVDARVLVNGGTEVWPTGLTQRWDERSEPGRIDNTFVSL